MLVVKLLHERRRLLLAVAKHLRKRLRQARQPHSHNFQNPCLEAHFALFIFAGYEPKLYQEL